MEPTGDFLTTAQVGELLNIPESTVRSWRQIRYGPPFARLRGRARYRRADVEKWFDSELRLTARR